MDFRTALPIGYELCVQDQNGGVLRYIIQKEIGRGGSCIVYDAIHQMNTGTDKHVRIKECYPFKLKIDRNSDQSLQIIPAEAEEFDSYIREMKSDSDMLQGLFEESLSDSITELWDIYEGNQTVYFVFTFSSGKTLLSDIPKTLKKCLEVVREIAYVIGKIHESGFLYLDVKPENILIEHGQTDRVLFCDFDSLFPITRESSADVSKAFRLSYSPHYAPIELITSQKKQLGPWTDVYSIGVLLFHLLFDRFPTMLDCMQNAEYDFSKIRPEYVGTYRDRLFFALADFFGKTLAPFYKSRYSSMQEVEQKLSDLEKLADLETPYICSTKIIPPTRLFARESELTQMNAWIEKKDPVLCISGLGGIGKSALVQKFLDNCRKDSDAILYLQYHDSLKETISDDFFAKINTVEKNPSENGDQYYRRKLKAFKDCVGERSIIAIDNFVWNESDDLNLLLDVGWRMILISREVPPTETFPQIVISPLPDDGQRELFEYNLGRPLQETEIVLFQKIADLIQGHTLVLELIAKQIVASFLSLEQAVELIEQKSFSQMAPESVNYAKDGKIYQSRMVTNIIAELFDNARLSEDEHALLKSVSLFGIPVEMTFLQEAVNKRSKDIFHRMNRIGFLELQDQSIFMHPVIREAVRCWKWTEKDRKDAFQIVWRLFSFFCFEYEKQYKTKQELDSLRLEKEKLIKEKTDIRKEFENADYEQRIHLREVLSSDVPPKEIEKTSVYSLYARALIEDPYAQEQFGKSCAYLELEFYIVYTFFQMDAEKIEYLLQNSYFQGDEDELKLIRSLISLYLLKGDKEKAENLLKRAEKLAKKLGNRHAIGFYNLIFADYCQFRGFLEKKFDEKAKEARKRAIHHFKKGKQLMLYLSCLCDEVFYYMIPNMIKENQAEHSANFAQTDAIISDNAQYAKKIEMTLQEIGEKKKQFPFSPPSLEVAFLRSSIFFHAITDENSERIKQELDHLKKILPRAILDDFSRMSNLCLPIADIISLVDDMEKEAEEWAEAGLAIFHDHPDDPFFALAAIGIYDLLLDIYEDDTKRGTKIKNEKSALVARFPEVETMLKDGVI